MALVDYQLTHMLQQGALRLGSSELDLAKYVQPASIDLPISGAVYLVKEKVLPFRKQVRGKTLQTFPQVDGVSCGEF